MLPTLYDGRTNHARTVLETISETYDLDVIEPPIPKTIKFAEAPAAGRSILATSRSSKGAKAYREAATHLVERSRQPAQRRKPSTGDGDRAMTAQQPRDRGPAPLRADGRRGRLARRHPGRRARRVRGAPRRVDRRQRLRRPHRRPARRRHDPGARRPARRTDGGTPRAPRPGRRRPGHRRRQVGRLHREPGRPPARRDAARRLRHRKACGVQREPPAGLAGRRRRAGGRAPTWSRAASTTTSTRARSTSTRAPRTPGASTTPAA